MRAGLWVAASGVGDPANLTAPTIPDQANPSQLRGCGCKTAQWPPLSERFSGNKHDKKLHAAGVPIHADG
jgi:hypothetical protein